MAIGDIGIWTDSAGSQQPGTTFGVVDYATETLNQGTHYSESAGTVTVDEAGTYLIIGALEYGGITARQNCVNKITHSGSGDFVSIWGSGYGRNTNNPTASLICFGLLVNAAATDTVRCDHKRDVDATSSGTVANISTLTVIRLHDSPSVGLYQDTADTGAFGTQAFVDVPFASTIFENDTASIQRTGTNIQLKNTARYLICAGLSLGGLIGNSNRTQRISRLVAGAAEIDASRGHAYVRDGETEFGAPNSLILYDNSGTNDISLQSQRGADTTVAGSGLARRTSESGFFAIELPSSAEVYIGVDGTALQDLGGATIDVNAMRTNSVIDTASFSSSTIADLTNDSGVAADLLVWGNAFINKNGASGTRLTVGGRFELNGVDQTRGRHTGYLRGTQGGEQCNDCCVQPVGVFDAVPDGQAFNFESYDAGDNGTTDQTQVNQVGFFAINLDTLEVAAGANPKGPFGHPLHGPLGGPI